MRCVTEVAVSCLPFAQTDAKERKRDLRRRDWDYRRALPWYQNTFLTKNFQVAEVFAAHYILERFPFRSIDADLAKPPIQDSLLFMFGISRVLFGDEFFQPTQLVSRGC